MNVVKRLALGVLLACSAAAHAVGSYVPTAAFGVGSNQPQTATPTFSPAAGSYSSTQSVTIADATGSSTIYYTLDNSTPTTGSTVYSGAISVSVTTTVKAIATAAGHSQSTVGSATYTITGSSGIKSHFGHYASSNSITFQGNPNAGQKLQEIGIMRANSTLVLGMQEGYTWNELEPTTLGVYNFTDLDTDYVNITGMTAGSSTCGSATYSDPRRMGIYIIPSDYFTPDPTSVLPTYITSNPGTYGAGYDGVHGGYWVSNGSGGIGTETVAAVWRPSVANRLEALMAAIAAHKFPDGCTGDGSPYVEAVWPLEETAQIPLPNTDPTFSEANYIAAMNSINAAGAASFPHTQFVLPNNYAGDETSTQTIETNLVTYGTAASGPDIFTPMDQDMTWGQHAYIGDGWNGSAWVPGTGTDLINVVPYVGIVDSTELGYEYSSLPADLFTFANGTLHATELWWTVVVANETGYVPGNWYGSAYGNPATWNPATSGGVLATIVNTPLSNTTCPSRYIALAGSCIH